MVEDFDSARVNPDRDALRVDALVAFVVSVIDVVVLLVQLLCVPEARLDGGPVFNRYRLCPHRGDECEDELGHRVLSSCGNFVEVMTCVFSQSLLRFCSLLVARSQLLLKS